MGLFGKKASGDAQRASSIDQVLNGLGLSGQDPEVVVLSIFQLCQEQLASGQNVEHATLMMDVGLRVARDLHARDPLRHHDKLVDGLLLAASAHHNEGNYHDAEQRLLEIIGSECGCSPWRNVPQSLTILQAVYTKQGRMADARKAASTLADLAAKYPEVARYVSAQEQLQNQRFPR